MAGARQLLRVNIGMKQVEDIGRLDEAQLRQVRLVVRRGYLDRRAAILDHAVVTIKAEIRVARLYDIGLFDAELEGQQPHRLGAVLDRIDEARARPANRGALHLRIEVAHAAERDRVFRQIVPPLEQWRPFARVEGVERRRSFRHQTGLRTAARRPRSV